MIAPSKKKKLLSRLLQLSRRLLPRAWDLRAALQRCDRHYRPHVAQAKGDEREELISEYMEARACLLEELEGIRTQQLLRRAWRYYIVAAKIPYGSEDHEDENWIRGWASNTWYLNPEGVALLQRQIEEAKKRNLERLEVWAKILGGLGTVLLALVSALVALILAWGR